MFTPVKNEDAAFSFNPLTHSNDTESSTGKANKLPVGQRKPAIFTGTKPQMETEISLSPFYSIKELREGPRSGTNTWRVLLREFTNMSLRHHPKFSSLLWEKNNENAFIKEIQKDVGVS